jgi:hypothetical protein
MTESTVETRINTPPNAPATQYHAVLGRIREGSTSGSGGGTTLVPGLLP